MGRTSGVGGPGSGAGRANLPLCIVLHSTLVGGEFLSVIATIVAFRYSIQTGSISRHGQVSSVERGLSHSRICRSSHLWHTVLILMLCSLLKANTSRSDGRIRVSLSSFGAGMAHFSGPTMLTLLCMGKSLHGLLQSLMACECSGTLFKREYIPSLGTTCLWLNFPSRYSDPPSPSSAKCRGFTLINCLSMTVAGHVKLARL
mmetsp:Transcript_23528/g.66883  ORF Transcript_23528/g.66883 Transcript_23528/m.66883 type:complete len:202 (+) Transcript_23528:44-649(+)